MQVIRRRTFLETLTCSALSATLGVPGFLSSRKAFAGQESRPNILLIMADDLGWMDIHCQGNKLLDTPHIDRLAKQGMRFTSGYAGAPVCSPTRAAMMTGQAPARIKLTNHAPGHEQDFGPEGAVLLEADNIKNLPLEHITIAERLKEAGYATGFVGKWHLSFSGEKGNTGPIEQGLRPEHQGFDLNVGGCFRGGPPTYFAPYDIPAMNPAPDGEYLPDRLANESIAFMRAHREQPFFLAHWPYSVHYPLEAREKLIKKYAKRKEDGLKDHVFAAMIEGMDTAIGRILSALDEMGLTENTLVIFTSDNGSYNGDNRPLRGSKGHLYEGGIRVPWIVRWPGHVAPRSTCNTPIISMDVYPTLLEAAGVSPETEKPLDGESIMPLLRQSGSLKRDAVYFHYPNYAFHQENRLGSAMREGKYKLLKFYDDDSIELYDLEEDIGEKKDLSQELPERAQSMAAKLERWLKETGAEMPKKVKQTQ